MRHYDTGDLDALLTRISGDEQQFIYNGLDCCITRELVDTLQAQLTPGLSAAVYDFERAAQAPALSMMQRGLRLDHQYRAEIATTLMERQRQLNAKFLALTQGAVGLTTNYRSPAQLQQLLYSELRNEPITLSFRGQRRVNTNREALEKLHAKSVTAQPFINIINALRGLDKKLQIITKPLDADGRFRCMVNIAGTETGRWSTQVSLMATGSNLQNITEELRKMFIPDEGMVFIAADLEQAEARYLGYLAEDEAYIAACESDDLHTFVAKMVWPNGPVPWTGDLKADKKLCDDTKFYMHHSYRDATKRLGHGSNYEGTAWTMSRNTKILLPLCETFRKTYYQRFPGIPRYHARVRRELAEQGYLTTPFGMRRWFFGDRRDDATVREGIAFRPQSTIAYLAITGLIRCYDTAGDWLQPLVQTHDGALFQCPRHRLAEAADIIRSLWTIPLSVAGRQCIIPVDIKAGLNWGKTDNKRRFHPDGNPTGLGSIPL